MLTMIDYVESKDGTLKYAFSNPAGAEFEAVFFKLPFQTTPRYSYTICVSTQAGCALQCRFCATGLNGFTANLSADEITEQIQLIRTDLIKQNKINDQDHFHIALMGMGEPMLNYENVMIFYEKVQNTYPTLNKMSVSTVGIIPNILKLANDPNHDLDLFVSVHSPYDTERLKIMPISKKYPLSQLMDACKIFAQKRQTFVNLSYLLIRDFNDSEQHAIDFMKLITPPHLFRVQLLLYNPIPELVYQRPLQKKVDQFRDILLKNNIEVMVVKSKGRDTDSGCGQLVRKKNGTA